MSRLWRIATREYLSYVRTVGFWLSMALLPLGLTLGAFLPSLLERASAQTTLAVVDLTGAGYAPRIATALDARYLRTVGGAYRMAALTAAGPEAAGRVEAAFARGGEAGAREELTRVAPRVGAAFKAPSRALTLVAPPLDAAQAGRREAVNAVLRGYVAGDKTLPDGGTLTAAAVISPGTGGVPALDFWTANVSGDTVEGRVSGALQDLVRADRLRAIGIDPERLAQLDAVDVPVRTLSPRAASGEVSLRDRLPAVVGFAMGMLLWSVVLTGAGILLNSVIEEKSSRILEVLLASASTGEIMGGKILGVAMTTLTVMGVWALLGANAILFGAPGFAEDLGAVLFGKGFLLYFAIYLVGGYIMYAAMFSALGSFCETTREAQTLLGPVMVLLTVPILFMTLAIRNPDAEILRILSWIPPFTPFLMAARAGGEPPLWEVAGTTALMAATTAGVVWLSARAFRAGALSTVKLEPRALLALLRGR